MLFDKEKAEKLTVTIAGDEAQPRGLSVQDHQHGHVCDAAGEGAAGAYKRPECQSSQAKVGGGVCHLGRVEDERVWPPDFEVNRI